MVKLLDIIKELRESSSNHLYKIIGVLTTDTTDRTQGAILSDMRSIKGVTIVTPKDYHGGDTPIDNKFYTVLLSVKIDPHPFETFSKEEVKNIIHQIRRVRGVRNFKVRTGIRRISERDIEDES